MTNKKCQICGNKFYGRHKRRSKLLCNRHYMQMRLYGKILKYAKGDKNTIIDCGKYCEMILRNRKRQEIARTKFDKKHLLRIRQYHWSLANWGYCRCAKLRTSLHRFILNAPRGSCTDHIDRNRLDNRDKNLRLVDRCQNTWNSRRSHLNKLGVVGVHLDTRDGKYYVRIRNRGRIISLGGYKTLGRAANIRKKAEKKYRGIFLTS